MGEANLVRVAVSPRQIDFHVYWNDFLDLSVRLPTLSHKPGGHHFRTPEELIKPTWSSHLAGAHVVYTQPTCHCFLNELPSAMYFHALCKNNHDWAGNDCTYTPMSPTTVIPQHTCPLQIPPCSYEGLQSANLHFPDRQPGEGHRYWHQINYATSGRSS